MPILSSLYLTCLTAVLWVGHPAHLISQELPPRHYQVKAVYLYNFTQFVEWPEMTFPETETPLVIGIIGEDPFGNYLDQVVSGETMKGHPLTIRRFNPDDEIKDCHILFANLPDLETAKLLEKIKGTNILTVSDSPEFLKAGGIIQFISENNKIHFKINPEASASAELKISSKLLRLAKIVAYNK